MPVTPSEALVERMAKRSFLSLWSEANPLFRQGKELCDLLVVCDPDIIIVSVKEAILDRGATFQVDARRWRSRTIEDSVRQVYGAERRIGSMSEVIKADRSAGLLLPPNDRRRIHRVAVALGAGGSLPITSEDFGKGFVHVLDEIGLDRVLGELDTITDFVDYLIAKETLADRTQVIVPGNESDLLAVYLHQGRSLLSEADVVLIQPGAWEELIAKEEWTRRKEADRESYLWDGLVEMISELTGVEGSLGAQGLNERESVLRVMAREARFNRRVLAQDFNEFMALAAKEKVRARQVRSPSGVLYVLLASGRDEPRERRVDELKARCIVARGMNSDVSTVIGIATEQYAKGKGFSVDVAYLNLAEWTEKHEAIREMIQREFGYFSSPRITQETVDEYPQ